MERQRENDRPRVKSQVNALKRQSKKELKISPEPYILREKRMVEHGILK